MFYLLSLSLSFDLSVFNFLLNFFFFFFIVVRLLLFIFKRHKILKAYERHFQKVIDKLLHFASLCVVVDFFFLLFLVLLLSVFAYVRVVILLRKIEMSGDLLEC